jgi:flagellar basal-body rod protein FlgC
VTMNEIMDIAASGLAAQRARMGAVASNLANMHTTRTAEGGPYRRRDPIFVAEPLRSDFGDRLAQQIRAVRVERIVADPREPLRDFDPSHPDANAEGYVLLPRVDAVSELADMLSARRSYDANLLIMRKAREMSEAALRIGR